MFCIIKKLSNNKKKHFRFNKSKKTPQTIEDKIKQFVLRNSRNGYFTKVSTLAWKFQIPETSTWEMVGTLLSENILEAHHDELGEMKLCEPGKTFSILNNSRITSTKTKNKNRTKTKKK